MAGDKFINPYNFVGFPPEKALPYTDTDRHTGVIEYSLLTKTPLFIPNSGSEGAFRESLEKKDHKSYDFFSYTELNAKETYEEKCHIPVIPGSEVRGAVRSIYETLTDSCMGLLNEEEYPIKRTAEKFKPALLGRGKNGKYILYQASSMRIGEKAEKNDIPQGFEECRNGTEIWFRKPVENEKHVSKPITQFSVRKNSFPQKGYLLKWGMGVKKGRYHLFKKTATMVPDTEMSRDEVERKLYRVVASYLDQPKLQKENEGAYREYRKDLEDFLQGGFGEYFPVNYSIPFKGMIYLSPATITKEVSAHTIGSLAGKFAPCKESFCPACQLFGYIGTDNESSSGSHIRFTDLYVKEEKDPKEYYLCDKITLPNLGSPKTGNVDFYLEKPENTSFWTYDYHVKNETLADCPGKLRGRKYYWHQPDVVLSKNIQPTNLNKTVRPVDEKVIFSGKVFFEGISRKQMKQLIWILNSGREELGIKLGAGKPLGLGSVFCTVDNVLERQITCTEGRLEYTVKEIRFDDLDYERAGFSKNVKEEFYKIAGWKSLLQGVQITYPRTAAQKAGELEEGYLWFTQNHKTVSGKGMAQSRTDMRIVQELPHILDQEPGLLYTAYGAQMENKKGNPKKHSQFFSNNENKPQTGRKKTSEGFCNTPFASLRISENGQMELPGKKGKK